MVTVSVSNSALKIVIYNPIETGNQADIEETQVISPSPQQKINPKPHTELSLYGLRFLPSQKPTAIAPHVPPRYQLRNTRLLPPSPIRVPSCPVLIKMVTIGVSNPAIKIPMENLSGTGNQAYIK